MYTKRKCSLLKYKMGALKAQCWKIIGRYSYNLYEIKVILMDDNFFVVENFHFATSDQTFGNLVDSVNINARI